MYVKVRRKYMQAALYSIGELRKTREVVKHDGVAANAGHGALTAMIISISEYHPTSLMIGSSQAYHVKQRFSRWRSKKGRRWTLSWWRNGPTELHASSGAQ
jgi:hypothetical protein